jgi:DNA polymerase delta subunit 2
MQLLWSHIAPTAPDTLSSYPFNDRDCFVLEDLPHVYFVGNCETFETRLVYEKETEKFCRLVCVPTFYNTGAAALVNLTTLDTYEL